MRIGVGIRVANDVELFCKEYSTVRARMSNKPTKAQDLLFDAMIKSLVSSGTWAKLDFFFWLANPSSNQSDQLIDWIMSTRSAVANNSPIFYPKKGVKFSGTNWIDSGYNPATNAVNFALNAATLGGFTTEVSTLGGNILMGNGLTLYVAPTYNTNSFRRSINNVADFTNYTRVASSGFAVTRKSASTVTIYSKGLPGSDVSLASSSIASGNIQFGRSGTSNYDDSTLLCAYAGGLLTDADHALLNTEIIKCAWTIGDSIALVGDSTVATYGTGASLKSLLNLNTILNDDVSVAGYTITNCKTAWQSIGEQKRYIKAVFIQCGVNSIQTFTIATLISQYQDLINIIRADIGASGKIICNTMTPCKAARPSGYDNWLALNAAIRGEGATPITGIDYVVSSHTTTMDDGVGNLKAEYDIDGQGLHPTTSGRQLYATQWQNIINSLFGL